MDTVSSANRARDDAEASTDIPPSKMVPMRTSWSCVLHSKGTSKTRAFLGCADGRASWDAAAPARSGATRLAAALLTSYEAAATKLSASPISNVGFEVAVDGSHASVDMTGTLPGTPVHGDIGQEITYWLTATAFSDATIDSVDFTFNGDCAAYGVASGGDNCMGTIDRRLFAKTESYEVAR
jgi:hypothetical protein